MEIIVNPSPQQWKALCTRAVADDAVIEERVRAILSRVEAGGDATLVDITREVEGRDVDSFLVSREQIAAASALVDADLKAAIAQAAANIRAFHSAQMPQKVEVETTAGVRCVRRSRPIDRVGLYIPGGSAPLFSTLLMLAIPAKIAGCREIVLCTPAGRDGKIAPAVLYAADFCGVDTIYSLGGAQAIAAMAFGTESIAPVSKIFGPGNRYVTKAKQMVSARGVAIDMPAGPSEVMVMADDTADARFVASDLLSQAEHGPDSQAMLVCGSEAFAAEVEAEVARQLALLPRKDIATKALENSRIVVFTEELEAFREGQVCEGEHRLNLKASRSKACPKQAEGSSAAVAFANAYAAEHLIISMRNPWDVAEQITAAGSVFIGNYSPESAGDYASGTNHTLPTMGLARAFSGIGLDSFMHSITYQELKREGLE
ncbi:MAG: histidinol dehydrogenase, partial [Bacteroidales bacterium]|nr:histidinol dehydrogenase [Bacteroidales bacterium]